jgi:hypothetical protein
VTNLAVSQSIVNSQLNLTFTWTDPGDYASYHVYGLSDSIYSDLADDLAGTLTLTGLDPTRVYTFRIQRGNDAGYSTAATITTTATQVFNPTTIEGLQFWVDATDTAGNGSGVADGTTISTWTDKSGKSNNATSGNATLQTDGRGRYLNCTATSYSLTTSSWIYQQIYTIFIVDKPLNYTSVYSLIGARSASSDDFNIKYDGNRGIVFSTYRDEQTLGNAFQGLSAPVNVWCFTNYGEKTAYWNKQVSGKYNSDSSIIDSLLGIGPYSGRLREILIYGGRMAESDREAVTDYLYNKWLPPPPQFPLPVTNGAVLWLDAQDPNTFYTNTAGTQRGTTAIKFWKDKTGSGNNMISSDGSLYTANGFTVFSPSGLTQSSTYLKTADATLFLVAKGGSGQGYFTHGTLTLSRNSLVSWRDGATANNNQFTDLGNIFIFYGQMKKGQLLSGTFVDASGVQTSYTTEGLSIDVGVARFALNGADSVKYGEVLYYNRVLTSAEMASVAGYLSDKWRIAIPAVASGPPPGARVWLDASDPYTLYRNGGVVTRWKDRSGNGNDAVPSGAPTGSAAGVRFTGSQKFQLPDGALPRGAYSAYILGDVSGNTTILNAGSKNVRRPMWVVGGAGTSSLVYSYDGLTWAAATNNPVAGSQANGIGWNGTYWIAVGANAAQTVCIAKSTDGLTWANSTNNPFSGGLGKGIAWNGSYWVAVGYNTDATVCIATSSDGMTWTESTDNPFSPAGQNYGNGNDIAWNGTYWVAVGFNGGTVCIAKSDDGDTWTNSTNNPFSGGSGEGIAWNGSYWVAVGYNSGNTVGIAKSDDGLNWTPSTNHPFSGSNGMMLGIAWNGSYWVAVGRNPASTLCIIKSTDGLNWTASTNNPFSVGNALGIAWNGSYWIVVGNNTGSTVSIATSTDGMTWTPSATNQLTGGLGVAAGLGPVQNSLMNIQTAVTPLSALYVAGGYGTNTLAYSTDGITWTASANGNSVFDNTSVTGKCFAVAYGNRWVAGGFGTNRLAYSTDGITWTGSTSGNSVLTSGCYVVAYGNGLWVAGGSGTNRLAYSTNGINWTGSTSGNSVFITGCNAVAYANELWVAGGFGTNQLAYSTDGITWTASTSGNSVLTGECDAIAYANGRWVAGGYGGTRLAYSTDGITWTASANGNSVFTSACWAVAYGNRWVAGGYGNNMLAYSTDGITWTGSTSGNSVLTTYCYAVAYTNGVWVAGGEGTNEIAYSTDGINWTASTSGSALITTECHGLAAVTFPERANAVTTFDNTVYQNLWVALGSGANTFTYSGDGVNWILSPTGNSLNSNFNTVAYGNGRWIAGSGGQTQLAYSTDGINWNAVTGGNVPFGGACNTVAYANGMWVAGGNGTNQFAYSTNGIAWSKEGNQIIFTNKCNTVAYGNGTWVAGGTGTTNLLAYSTDGRTWTANSTSVITNQCQAVAYGNRWVAGGNGTNQLAYSTNGITWTASTSGNSVLTGLCYAVAYGNGRWVAGGVGTNQLAYSTDGINWTASTSGNSVLTYLCSKVAYSNGIWVASGYNSEGDGQMAYSTDGINWTASASGNSIFTSSSSGGFAGAIIVTGTKTTLTDTNAIPNGNTTVIVESLYGTGKSLYLSGITGPTDTSSRYQDASNNYIGWDLSGSYMNGTIKEILVYGVKHTTAQRQQVERYLKNKWYPSAYKPTGAALWLDSDPASLSYMGTGVRIWRDKMGRADARQDQVWAQPVFSTDPVTGKRGLQFGSDGMATGFTTSPFTNTSSWSIMAVQRYDYSSDQPADAVNGLTNTLYDASGFRVGTAAAAPSVAELTFIDSSGQYATAEIHKRPVITEQVVSGLLGRNYVNGISIAGSRTFTDPLTSSTQLKIGYTVATPSIQGAMRGYIYELVAYNSALSTSDRQALEGYLAWKWGVQDLLATTHPYFLAPP